MVQDNNEKTVAIFKPELERNWGPHCRVKENRRSDPSLEDMHFHQMPSFEQGQASKRQYLANLLDFGTFANVPKGEITELQSDQFVNPDCNADVCASRITKKVGYLQEWISKSESLKEMSLQLFGKEFSLSEHPILYQVSLSEFQKIGVLDVLIYNEDRHAGNLLVTKTPENDLKLTPIDCDSIMPFKLQNLESLTAHPRAKEAFTTEIRQLIDELDPDKIASTIKSIDLLPQAAESGKALAIVIKEFAKEGKTLFDIHHFVSEGPQQDSTLWKIMKSVKETAIASLNKESRDRYLHAEHLRWLKWQNQPLPVSGGEQWLKDYNSLHASQINTKINDNFWKLFVDQIKNKLKLK